MPTHRIRFRRPETPWSLSQMTAESDEKAVIQVDRLIALGYAIADVSPPLAKAPVFPSE
jgi:hypothetical protein